MVNGLVQISQAIDERFAEIDAVRRGEFPNVIPTGFKDIDHLVQGGFRPMDYIILCGRPSSGKSALMMAMVMNMALSGKKIGIFSLEMSLRGLTGRLLSMRSLVDNSSIRSGYVTQNDLIKLQVAGKELSSLPIYIDDTGGLTVRDIRERIYKEPVEVCFIDYLQLVNCRESTGETERVSKISRDIKELCKEFKIPFVVACQLNRDLEHRRDKRPMLSDLRSSGQLEQDTDACFGLYRPEMYDPSPEFLGYAEAIAIKNREGQLGTAKLNFTGKYSLFTNYAPQNYNGLRSIDTIDYNSDASDIGD